MYLRLFGATAALACSPLAAQITTSGTLRVPGASTAAAVVAAPAPGMGRMMPAQTMVEVTPTQEVSSKHIEEGQQVSFATVGDVTEGGNVVIPRGSPVVGTITWKTGRAIGGKSGKFEVRFDSVRVRGQSYPMKGTYRQEGRGNTVGALLGSIVITGRSAVMLPGQVVNAFTASEIAY